MSVLCVCVVPIRCPVSFHLIVSLCPCLGLKVM